MSETVHRFMPARDLMSLIAGNWASLPDDREGEEPREADGLLAVEVPRVRFVSTREHGIGDCRGGVVALDLAPLTEGEDYLREGGDVYVLADVLVQEPVSVQMRP